MSYTTLVDVATLQSHLDDPAWLVVDVRHQLADTGYGERVYAENHIPGAFFLHCDRDLSGPITIGLQQLRRTGQRSSIGQEQRGTAAACAAD